jgi:hypothetical protein
MPVDPVTAAIVGSIVNGIVQGAVTPSEPVAAIPVQGFPRILPEDTLRGEMVVLDLTTARVNGKIVPMTPGVQIRDPFNMLMLPLQVQRQRMPVRYQADAAGAIRKIWILSQQEAAQR